MPADRPHIAIAGGGYAGLSAYLALRRSAERGDADLTLVNDTDAHLLLPELPLYLAGEEGAQDVRIRLGSVIQPPARLCVAQVARVDPVGPCLVLREGEGGALRCDGLILALGSIGADFGVPGVAEHATVIGRWDDARELRQTLLRDLSRRAGTRVVVVGGGFTGVEVAAELASAHGPAARVVVIGPGLLPDMPREVQKVASSAMRGLGVRFIRARVTLVEAGRVRLRDGGAQAADTVIWAAGVRANPVVRASGLQVNGKGQAVVEPTLRAGSRIYAAGDCAAVHDPRTGRGLAPTAQAAMQQGPAAALNLLREILGQEPRPFTPRDRGFLVSLGDGQAAGTVFGRSVAGGDVAVLKGLIEAYHAFHIGGLKTLGSHLRRLAGEPEKARV